MTRPPRQSSEADLDALEATCQRLAAFDPHIGVEWVDGFLASVAAGQRLAGVEQWLPALFGDTFERVFADPEDHARGLRPLQARLKVLYHQLDPEALLDAPDWVRLEPLMVEYTDAERASLLEDGVLSSESIAHVQTGALWAQGFLEGVEALPALWRLPEADPAAAVFQQSLQHVAALVLPLGSQELSAHVQEFYPQQPPSRDDLITEACMAVQDLRLYWVDFAPKPATRRIEATPGRNDPCPCGSGKKYKKCHGA